MTATRSYRMTARAAGAAATRRRIADALIGLAQERLTIEITLDDIARRAGTTVQTVLRHYGSRDGLFDAVTEIATADVQAERAAPVGDPAEALRILVDHYELRGDFMVRMLSQESGDARIRSFTEPGRAMHRRWVEAVFAPWLTPAVDPEALTDLLVVATDLATWRLLRRDRGHDRATTELRMRALVDALLTPPPPSHQEES
jgi:AcrR family transcriptional regulator